MIIDKLSNVDLYAQIPDFAKDFIKNISLEMADGRYELPDGCYANIESYSTKTLNEGLFEAHKEYIDIQILLKGKERIYYSALDGLSIKEPYNPARDIMFFSNNIGENDYLTLNSSNFALIYPHEAHAPQIAPVESEIVKKVVVKVKI
ncbi:MAG: YhcH/YjgK/YiaL family protein [Muribaculaceae bacterium]|nr:YhcH/YjgK/YiaL family protein [Muribaculaceae bacterium]